MVTGQYPPDINGAALQCKSVVDTLEHKIEFHVATSPLNYAIKETRCARVHRVLLFNGALSTARSLLRFMRLLFVNRFDIVHFHGYSRKTLPLAILSKLGGAKIALKFTSFGVDDFVSVRRRGFVHLRGLTLFDIFFCPAPAFIPKTNEGRSCAILSRCFRLNNGVDLDRFAPVSLSRRIELREQLGISIDTFTIVSIAHFSEDKGLIDILGAMDVLAKLSRHITIFMIGSRNPSNYEVSQSLVRRFGAVQKDLNYSGIDLRFVDRTYEVWKYLQSCDAYVLTSRREGSPNALLQAMACNLPCVATKLPGITDAIITDGVDGLLYQAGDTTELGRLIGLILSNQGFASTLGECARRRISDVHDLKKTSYELFQSYTRLLT